MVFRGLGVARVPCPPTSAGPSPPSPMLPWHAAHFAANTVFPSTAVPEPTGNPVPSGATMMPSPRVSASVGGRPTPYLGDCASVTVPASSSAAAATALSRLHIGHAPVGTHLPQLDPVVVEARVHTAHRDQRFS